MNNKQNVVELGDYEYIYTSLLHTHLSHTYIHTYIILKLIKNVPNIIDIFQMK